MAALAAQLAAILPDGIEAITVAAALEALARTSKPVRDAIYQLIRDGAAMGVVDAARGIELTLGGLSVDWTGTNTAAAEWASRYAGELIVGIDNTTRRAVQRAVSEWIDNALPMDDLIRELSAPTGPFGRQRAEMIAITEVTRAFVQGNLQVWRDSGVVSGYYWLTANDERVCPICAPLGGLEFGEDGAEPASIEQQQRQRLETAFGVPFTHPGGSGAADRFKGRQIDHPPAHPRCRCDLRPIVSRG